MKNKLYRIYYNPLTDEEYITPTYKKKPWRPIACSIFALRAFMMCERHGRKFRVDNRIDIDPMRLSINGRPCKIIQTLY